MAVASLSLGGQALLSLACALFPGVVGLEGPRAPELAFMAGALLALLAILFGAVGMKRARGIAIAGLSVGAVCFAFCTAVCVLGLVAPDKALAWFSLDFRVLMNPASVPR